MFITFNTVSQAKNYIKRNHPVRNDNDGCGCCYSYSGALIKDNKVFEYDVVSVKGDETHTKIQIGKIKSRGVKVPPKKQ